MKNIILLLLYCLGAVAAIMAIYISGNNWDRILSPEQRFELLKWPIILTIIALIPISLIEQTKK